MIKWIVIGSIFIILASGFFLIRPLLKSPDFHTPTGNYGIGTKLYVIKDIERIDHVTAEQGRKLAVRVFYPTEKVVDGEIFIGMNSDISQAFAELYNMPAGSADESSSNTIIDAEISQDGPFPVVIFSHGGFSYSTQNLSSFEELVSNGYIVVTLDHTHESVASVFPNGESIGMFDKDILSRMQSDPEVIADYSRQIDILKSDASYQEKADAYVSIGNGLYNELQPYLLNRIEDIHEVIEFISIENSNSNSFLNGKMDLNSVGMFGHSFGGVTTSYICSEENSIVSAGINLDAPVVNFSNTPLVLKKKFAFFYSTESSLGRGTVIDMSGTNNFYVETSEKDTFSIKVDGSAHYNYSDFNYMPPIFKFTPMLGSIEPIRMSEILNKSILDFFDYTLKNKNSDNMFENKQSDFDELSFL